jgi:prepilin-type N-terminal cleavage/methylation domain-containing protein
MISNRCSRLLNKNGFTMVEIAIVLVIIGIILGGVLKGQSMVEHQKLKSLKTTADTLAGAMNAYQDKYGALPGDDVLAATHLASSGCTAAQIANGNGDGKIAGAELYTFFSHLLCAGLITGSYDGTSSLMTNRYGALTDVETYTAGTRIGLAVKYAGMDGAIAQKFDEMFDDNNYNQGNIRGSAAYTSGAVSLYYFF